MGLLLLIGCATDKVINENPAICAALTTPLDTHIDTLVENGEGITKLGADEVLVTADILATAFDAGCE